MRLVAGAFIFFGGTTHILSGVDTASLVPVPQCISILTNTHNFIRSVVPCLQWHKGRDVSEGCGGCTCSSSTGMPSARSGLLQCWSVQFLTECSIPCDSSPNVCAWPVIFVLMHRYWTLHSNVYAQQRACTATSMLSFAWTDAQHH